MNMLSADELASLLGQQDVGHEVVSSGGGALSLPSSRPHFGVLPARFSQESRACFSKQMDSE